MQNRPGALPRVVVHEWLCSLPGQFGVGHGKVLGRENENYNYRNWLCRLGYWSLSS